MVSQSWHPALAEVSSPLKVFWGWIAFLYPSRSEGKASVSSYRQRRTSHGQQLSLQWIGDNGLTRKEPEDARPVSSLLFHRIGCGDDNKTNAPTKKEPHCLTECAERGG